MYATFRCGTDMNGWTETRAMPYYLVRDGRKYQVRKRNSGKLVGTTTSRTKAERMIRAIYYSEHKK